MHKIKNLFSWLLFVGLALSLAWPSLSPALAVAGDGVSVFPASTKDHPGLRSWFVYEAEPGTEIKDKVELINNTSKAATLLVAVLDGAVTSDGGYTLVGGTTQNKDLGTWATLSEEEVSLPPRSKKIIDLTIKVPENADVGSHPGGVVVWRKPEQTTASKKGSQLSVVTRVAARVYLTVPGDIKRILEVTNIKHQFIAGVLHFVLKMKNTGNVQLQPEADIKLRGWWGSLGTQAGTPFGLLLRNTSITGRAPWNGKQPKFGRYVADFRIHYGEKDFKAQYVKDEYIDVRYVFWVIPWLPIIFALGGILLLIFLRNLWLWLVIQQRLNIKSKKHIVKKSETLTIIAGHYYVHPKQLAKFNLLKWPYELTPGDVLLIPQGRLTKAERLAMGKEWQAYYRAEQRKVWLTDLKFIAALFGKIRFRHRRTSITPPFLPLHKGRLGGVTPLPVGRKGGVTTERLIAEKGDTITDVAAFAGTSVEAIAQLNNLRYPYRLRAGQELLVPVKQRTSKPRKTAGKLTPPTLPLDKGRRGGVTPKRRTKKRK